MSEADKNKLLLKGARAVSRCKMTSPVIEDVAHAIHVENPGAFTDCILHFQQYAQRGLQSEAAGLGVLISTSSGSIATKFIVANQKLSM